ncbi:MAG TPA: hypothetical protein VEC38_02000 [Candidatus Binataceae bacterium]|nr:hypothetical protein [Candidatus Binataceae bacterium]
MGLRTAILWIHALAGAVWIAACGCLVIAGLALEEGSEEHRNFAVRVAPKIDRLNVAMAVLLAATGATSFVAEGIPRGFRFSHTFVIVLGVKTVLFIAMAIMMAAALRTGAVIRAAAEKGPGDAIAGAMARLIPIHGAIAAMGGVALLLGVWLLGT